VEEEEDSGSESSELEEEKSNLLSVRIGTKKIVLPQNIQILQDGSHMFISFSGTTDIYALEGKNASLITDTVQASEAIQTLKSNIEKQRMKRRAKKTLEVSPELEKALRVADFIDLGEIMVVDALDRNESCGGHFREEYQTPDGEALRRDDEYAYVSAWEFKGADQDPVLHKEMLHFDNVELKTRSYK
jgi:succinate dehydrogenase/fumarate reductase flavoprotein subunit